MSNLHKSLATNFDVSYRQGLYQCNFVAVLSLIHTGDYSRRKRLYCAGSPSSLLYFVTPFCDK